MFFDTLEQVASYSFTYNVADTTLDYPSNVTSDGTYVHGIFVNLNMTGSAKYRVRLIALDSSLNSITELEIDNQYPDHYSGLNVATYGQYVVASYSGYYQIFSWDGSSYTQTTAETAGGDYFSDASYLYKITGSPATRELSSYTTDGTSFTLVTTYHETDTAEWDYVKYTLGLFNYIYNPGLFVVGRRYNFATQNYVDYLDSGAYVLGTRLYNDFWPNTGEISPRPNYTYGYLDKVFVLGNFYYSISSYKSSGSGVPNILRILKHKPAISAGYAEKLIKSDIMYL